MNRRAAYKFQANADYRKTLRSKAADVKRKEERCKVMMNNRRLPLGEKNEVTEKTAAAPVPVMGKGN